jgi:hypothetical protein
MAIIRSRYFLAPLFSIASLAVPGWAHAQTGLLINPSDNQYAEGQGRYYDTRRDAYDYGYREGVRAGEQDARRGDRFNYEDEREFRNGDGGYRREYGDRDRYRQTFRSGYAAGYNDGYRRNGGYNGRYGQGDPRDPRYGGGYGDPRYGGGVYGDPRYGGRDPRYGRSGGGYYSIAFDNGSRDGFEKGQEDARKNRSFDPLRHSWYRSGDRHYERQYGSRDEYKNIYRRGFQEGYDRGYREGRYRW